MNIGRNEINTNVVQSTFEIEVDGKNVAACEGETIAAALTRAGIKAIRYTRNNEPRGIFCGMGVCFECRMIVNGKRNTRICQTPATPGCVIQTQHGDY